MKYFFANWKAYVGSLVEAEKLAELSAGKNVTIFPSAPHLGSLAEKYAGQIILGAQNISPFAVGAYTGEVVGEQLFNLGVKYVLIGHSERRHFFGEGLEIISEKIMRAQDKKIIPVLCVGESAEVRAQNRQEPFVQNQLQEVLGTVAGDYLIAYEPIWAIGTSQPCTLADAEQMATTIIEQSKKFEGKFLGVLYGGSVDPNSFKEYWSSQILAGALIGSASADYDKMKSMVEFMA